MNFTFEMEDLPGAASAAIIAPAPPRKSVATTLALWSSGWPLTIAVFSLIRSTSAPNFLSCCVCLNRFSKMVSMKVV